MMLEVEAVQVDLVLVVVVLLVLIHLVFLVEEVMACYYYYLGVEQAEALIDQKVEVVVASPLLMVGEEVALKIYLEELVGQYFLDVQVEVEEHHSSYQVAD